MNNPSLPSSSSSSSSSTSMAQSRLELFTRLISLFDGVDRVQALQLVKGIARAGGTASRGDSDPNQVLKGLSLRYAVNLQPALSQAISSTHSALRRKVREHEDLALKDRQRWMRQKEANDLKRELGQGSSSADRDRPQPPWQPLVGERNLQDVLKMLFHLQQAPDISTQAHATLITSGPTSRSYFSVQDQEEADRAIWDSIFNQNSSSSRPATSNFDQNEETDEGNSELDSENWSSSDREGYHRRGNQTNEAFNQKKKEKEKRERVLYMQRTRRREQRRRQIQEEAQKDQDESLQLDRGLSSVKSNQYWKTLNQDGKQLTEAQALLECLFALEGLPSVLFERVGMTEVKISSAASSIKPIHLSESTFRSLMVEIASRASLLNHLRSFVSYSRASTHNGSMQIDPTMRYLGDAIASLLERFGQLVLQKREDIASLFKTPKIYGSENQVISLVAFATELERTGQALKVLEEILIEVGIIQDQGNLLLSSTASSQILDALQETISFYWSLYDSESAVYGAAEEESLDEESRLEILKTAEDLSRCFLAAAEPVWEEVKLWVGEGMEIRFDQGDDGDPFLEANVEQEGREVDGRLGFEEKNKEVLGLSDHIKRSKKLDFIPSFAKRNSSILPHDGRFWKEGWSASSSPDSSGIVGPSFIAPLAAKVLGTGKCVGLLRALGWEAEILGSEHKNNSLREILNPNSSNQEVEPPAAVFDQSLGQKFLTGLLIGPQNLVPEDSTQLKARSLSEEEVDLTRKWSQPQDDFPSDSPPPLSPSSSSSSSPPQSPSLEAGIIKSSQAPLAQIISTSALVSILSSYLEPRLTLVQKKLHDVLTSGWEEQGCDLPAHVDSFLGLFLWRRGREMSQWINVVFELVDDGKGSIFDSQFLNAAFREEIISSGLNGGGAWLDTSLVRFLHARRKKYRRGGRDWFVGSGVRALSALRVEYLVPFPLTYFFTPSIQLHYQALFTLQLQFTRAQYLLARMAPARRGKISRDSEFVYHSEANLRFIQIRKRLLWIVRVLFDFVSRDIIETHSQSMLSSLSNLVSFDSLIDLHSSSIKRIAALCFLREFPSSKEASLETETDSEAVEGLRNGTDVHELILDVLDCADEVAASCRQKFGAVDDEEDSRMRQQASRRRRGRRKEKEARLKARREGQERRRRSQEEDSEEEDEEEAQENEEERATGASLQPNMSLSAPNSNLNVSFSSFSSEIEEPFSSKMKRLNLELERDIGRIKVAVQAKIAVAGRRRDVGARGHWQDLAYTLDELALRG